MVTAEDFRRIALGLTGAAESAHMSHPDFRINGRIFATLHHDMKWCMVKVSPAEQQDLVRAAPAAFAPEKGAWGLQGCTAVRLDAVDEETLGEALTLAARGAAASPAARSRTKKRR